MGPLVYSKLIPENYTVVSNGIGILNEEVFA